MFVEVKRFISAQKSASQHAVISEHAILEKGMIYDTRLPHTPLASSQRRNEGIWSAASSISSRYDDCL
jgi:hypothetical protein